MFKFSMSQLIFRIPQDVRLDSLNSRCFRLILWPSPRSWSRKWFPCVFFIHTNPHSVASMEAGLQSTKTNKQTDRLRLQSGLFHFGNRPFCPSFLVLTLFPPCLCGSGCVYFTTVPHPNGQFVPVCFKQTPKPKFTIVTEAVAHQIFPPMLSGNHKILTEKKKERKRPCLVGSPRLTILQSLCIKQQECW